MQSHDQSCQQAVFAALTGAGLTVYDKVPQHPDGGSAGAFPYWTVGDINGLDGPTQGGAELVITLHGWSRYAGKAELQRQHAIVYALLHEQTLPVTDFEAFYISWESSEYLEDPDGKTQHGVFRYRAFIDQTE